MDVLLCGVRGSTPATGAEFVEFGGDTSCVAIPAEHGRWLILDAGTGLANLAADLGDEALRGSILLTHLHWDHTHGLPFLANADHPDAEVDVWLPAPPGDDPAEVLASAMSPPHFPIGPGDLRGRWRYHAAGPGRWEVEGFSITAAEVCHKGGRTLGYRVDDGESTVAYLPDHAPRLATAEQRGAAMGLADGADVLLHGGGFLAADREMADAYGHATIDDAVELAEAAGARQLVIVHHSPWRTDKALAAIEREMQPRATALSIGLGRQGQRVASCAVRS
ncbi:MAG: MBL fold metallo-hydrolase [Acidimicrobiales bacterium]